MTFQPPLSPPEVEAAYHGRYTGLAEIHAGGQGIVFRGTAQGPPAVDVALKIYFPTVQGYEERSDREVDALRQMQCATIVRLHDSGRVTLRGRDCPFVATTFVEGETVAARLQRGPMDVATAARLGHDVALAIDELWSRRIVHRDLKPSNIMLATSGGGVVIDLGVARHVSLQSLTATGLTWGTVGFLSPEQARAAKQLTCKSDVFALGIVLQECLAGRHPTGNLQPPLARGGPPTTQVAPAAPPDLAAVIDSMLVASPVARPLPSAIAADLRRFF